MPRLNLNTQLRSILCSFSLCAAAAWPLQIASMPAEPRPNASQQPEDEEDDEYIEGEVVDDLEGEEGKCVNI